MEVEAWQNYPCQYSYLSGGSRVRKDLLEIVLLFRNLHEAPTNLREIAYSRDSHKPHVTFLRNDSFFVTCTKKVLIFCDSHA